MPDLSNINVTVTAAIDNTSLVKLAVVGVLLIMLFFLFKKFFG